MAAKKNDDGPTPDAKGGALEQRVAMIMGEKNADGVTPAAAPAPEASEPAIDIFKDPTTAPAVSPKLMKQIGADESTPDAAPAGAETAAAESKDVPSGEAEAGDVENSDTDKAVDDIVVNESDTVLAAEDAANKSTDAPAKKTARSSSKFGFLRKRRFWLIAIIVVLIGLFVLPMTRYKLLGLVIKRPVTVTVQDSVTHTAVSNAAVQLGSVTAKTDADGKAHISAGLGQRALTVTKQYYQTSNGKYFVGFKSGQTTTVQLVATGRQVPITVTNKITGQPLANAQISVLGTTAKTNQKGQATVVLPTKASSDAATLSLSGYNTAKVTVTVTSQVVSANSFTLTPAGQIYFLSNLSGTIDVVKANLDGTNRTIVLAGTGKEDPNATSLLASRDWQYLVLEAQRDTPQPALYLINTSTGKVTNFDSGDAGFSLIGWYNHTFLYDVTRNSVSAWQSGHEVVKAYNADNGQLNVIDQNQAEGNSSAYGYQSFTNFYIVSGLLTYNTIWYTNGSYDISGKSDTIRGIQSNGQGKKDYQSFSTSGTNYIEAELYKPQIVYYGIYDYLTSKTTYYQFQNQAVTSPSSLDASDFSQGYPTYLLSPSGGQTFWTEVRDGKNTLFVGDSNAGNPKQIASLSSYAAYGWYSDNYVLVSKDSSELYVMPASGLSGNQQPVKISDYYKPPQSYQGYGYGYGGL